MPVVGHGFPVVSRGGGGAVCVVHYNRPVPNPAEGRRLFVALALSMLAGRAGAQDRTIDLAGRSTAIWEPTVAANHRGPSPVLIFSHGFGGCATGVSYLMKALAGHGYWVFAPQHKDGSCNRRAPGRPEEPFRDAAQWTEHTYSERRDDVLALEGALKLDRRYASRLDFSRLGYLGHSLGGYTVLGLAGAWPSWASAPKPRAVLAMSPYIEPYLASKTLGDVDVPVMLQGGTLDLGITPSLTKAGGAYDALSAPKYLVVFTGARHLTWGNAGTGEIHAAIMESAIAFLDRYVLGRSAPTVLTNAGDGVASLRYDSELGKSTGAPAAPRRIPRGA
jgi:predicted dienelactone hydrolase